MLDSVFGFHNAVTVAVAACAGDAAPTSSTITTAQSARAAERARRAGANVDRFEWLDMTQTRARPKTCGGRCNFLFEQFAGPTRDARQWPRCGPLLKHSPMARDNRDRAAVTMMAARCALSSAAITLRDGQRWCTERRE